MKNKTQVRSVRPEVLARAAEIIKLLGHPLRLKILEVLEAGDATVSEIQEVLEVPQATVSQQLAKLRGLDVVTAKRDGVNVVYSLAEAKVPRILNCIRECDI
jgi:DNA-binding transcriptional ArsR family regulator